VPTSALSSTPTLAAARRRSLRRRIATVLGAFLIGGVTPAAAFAYWDYTGYLSPGASYGEGQSGTSGYWYIRLSRSNCNADSWLHRRSDGSWEWFGAPCSYSDYTTQYPLSTYNASHALNGGSSDVWVNVRIDGAV
jgi:hypothetical protein